MKVNERSYVNAWDNRDAREREKRNARDKHDKHRKHTTSTGPHEDCYLLGGTEGSLAIPTLTHVKNERGGGRPDPFVRKELFYVPANPWVEELLHFADLIRGRAPSMITADDGMRTLAAVLAVMRSAEERRPVSIAEML